jgi:hypothetical protein
MNPFGSYHRRSARPSLDCEASRSGTSDGAAGAPAQTQPMR